MFRIVELSRRGISLGLRDDCMIVTDDNSDPAAIPLTELSAVLLSEPALTISGAILSLTFLEIVGKESYTGFEFEPDAFVVSGKRQQCLDPAMFMFQNTTGQFIAGHFFYLFFHDSPCYGNGMKHQPNMG